MFSSLIDAGRHIRGPLATGYLALVTAWLWLADVRYFESLGETELGTHFADLASWLGPATQFALVTFVAYMVGSFVCNVAIDPLGSWLQSKLQKIDWDQFVEEGRIAAREYETYRVETHSGDGVRAKMSSSHYVPSPTWAAYLVSQADDRARLAGEFTFRMTLALALAPFLVSVLILGGLHWWIAGIPLALIVLDAFCIGVSVRARVLSLEEKEAETKVEELTARVEHMQRDVQTEQVADSYRAQVKSTEEALGMAKLRLAELVRQRQRGALRWLPWL